MITRTAAGLLLAIAAAPGALLESPEPDNQAAAAVTGASMRRHMEVLASDEMRGREAGTADFQKAADYVASRFREAGLEPLGHDGDYFQRFPLLESRLIPESAHLAFERGSERVELAVRNGFVSSGGFGAPEEQVTAPLVFAGHGISAPDLGHDDYAEIDPRGRILVILSGAPPGFDTDRRAFYSSSSGKSERAAQRGAVGLLTVRTPVDQERRAWERLLPGVGSPAMRWLDREGAPFEGFPELSGTATLSELGAQRLFQLAGRDLAAIFEKHAAGETGSFELGVTATLAQRSQQRKVTSANVLGVLPGSDPALRDEYVVYTAHLDHIGIRPGEDGDEIHNGAYDNAAGVGAILEIAEALGSVEPRPRRSILFAAVTAEEKGLRGSSYLAHNPPVPAERLVADINIDMPYLGFPVGDVHAFGAEHSTLHAAALEAATASGLELTPDPLPEEVRFVRSDQFSFVKQGIPALAWKAGSRSADPSVDGEAALREFLTEHYHQPSDELDLPWDQAAAARFVRAALRLGLIVADADERPRWNEGDFFGDLFAPGSAAP